jgi:hypothetical protein
MGWWNQTEDGYSLMPNETGMVWGDSVADIMDDAVHAIIQQFEKEWMRKPTRKELMAGLQFSMFARGLDEG